MRDVIADRLNTATRTAQRAHINMVERVAMLRNEIDGARRVAAITTTSRPALHKAIRRARVELSKLVSSTEA